MTTEACGTCGCTCQTRLTVADRLARKTVVDDQSGCWIWQGKRDSAGYGFVWINGRYHRAARIAFTDASGAIADGLTIDHLCRNTSCVNPAHLEAVTVVENVRRAWTARNGSTPNHCRNGHPLGDGVRKQEPNGRVRFSCRECARASSRRHRLARKERQASP